MHFSLRTFQRESYIKSCEFGRCQLVNCVLYNFLPWIGYFIKEWIWLVVSIFPDFWLPGKREFSREFKLSREFPGKFESPRFPVFIPWFNQRKIHFIFPFLRKINYGLKKWWKNHLKPIRKYFINYFIKNMGFYWLYLIIPLTEEV